MKMKKILALNVLVSVALLALSTVAAAQEVAIRKGVVTGIAPIQVQVQVQAQAARPQRPTSTGNALTRSLSRLAGRAASNATDGSYDAYDIASSATRDATTSTTAAASARQNTGTAYMVMIKFDDGSESAIQSADASGLAVGAPVRVLGSGESAQIIPGS